MIFKFALRINDELESVSPESGIDVEDFVPLLRDLSSAIDPGDKSFFTLSDVNNSGYTPNFVTNSERRYLNFINVYQNIYARSIADLAVYEARYANTLKRVLTKGKYLEPYDMDQQPIVRLYPDQIEKSVESYNAIKKVEGVISEIGSPSLSGNTHIYLDGLDYKIYTNSTQDNLLRNYYRKVKITFTVKQKIAIIGGRVISASLITFEPKGTTPLMESLSTLTNDDLSFLHSVQTHEDIIRLIKS